MTVSYPSNQKGAQRELPESPIRILGICGSPVRDGNAQVLLNEALGSLGEDPGITTRLFPLSGRTFSGCLHCNWCVRHQQEGRFCVQEDDLSELYPEIIKADGILLASPVHFGRLSAPMAAMVDRLRPFVHGNRYGGALRNKVGGALVVAFFRGGGVETALMSLVTAFLALEMIVATSRLYQLGAAGLTSLHGTGRVARGVRHGVLEDEYGVASSRALARRMAELARMVRAASGARVP